MLLTNEKNSQFGTRIMDLLEDAISVRIASGYIGLETFHSRAQTETNHRDGRKCHNHFGPGAF